MRLRSSGLLSAVLLVKCNLVPQGSFGMDKIKFECRTRETSGKTVKCLNNAAATSGSTTNTMSNAAGQLVM